MLPSRVPTLSRLIASQAGVFTRAQARAAGYTAAQIETAVRRGTWLNPRYGVFAIAEDTDPCHPHALACAARRLVLQADTVVSHASAGILLGLPCVDVPDEPTLTLARHGAADHPTGLYVAKVPAEHRLTSFGLPITTGPRTVVDLLRTARTGLDAQALADGALRADVSRADVEKVLSYCSRWPGIVRARNAWAFGEPLCESPLESRCRIWFRDGGLPAPTPQYRFKQPTGRVIARVDFYFEAERVVVEADGQLKYDNRKVLWDEKRREDTVRDLGIEVVRATWDDGRDGGADLVRRVRRAFERAARR